MNKAFAVLALIGSMGLGACAIKDENGNQVSRLYDCKEAVDASGNVKPGYVVNDSGSGQHGNGKFCYGPKN